MKKLITLFCLAISVKAGAQNGYSTDRIPKELLSYASAVTRTDETIAEIKSKDEVLYHYKMVRTILNSNGDKYAGLTEYHDKARIIKPIKGFIYDETGKQIGKISDHDFEDSYYDDSFSLFTDLKVKHYNPGITTYPYTVEYDYDIVAKQTLNIDSWYTISADNVSVEHSSYTLICRPDLKMRFNETNYAGKAAVGVTANGMKAYNWQVNNLKAIRTEPFSPDENSYTTHVSFAPEDFAYEGLSGTYNNWQNLGKWSYDKLLAGRANLSPQTVQEMQQLTKGITSPKEKAKKVYEYMQQKTRYISIQIGIGGYQPFPAAEVDRLSYGDCKGLVNYTQALLKAVDINSYYCIVKAGSEKTGLKPDFASMDQANHIILCLPFKNDTTWLECTSKTIPFGFLGDFTDDREVLACTPEGGKLMRTPKYAAIQNFKNKHAEFKLADDGTLEGAMNTTFSGSQYERRDYYLQEAYQDQLKQIKKAYPINNMEVEKLSFNATKSEMPEINENLKLKVLEYASAENGRLLFLINIANRINAPLKEIHNRTTPLYINRGFTDDDNITYTMPDGYRPDKTLLSIELRKKFGSYKANISVSGNQLIYNRKMQLIDGTYSKEDYEEMVEFYQSVYDADHYTMTLAKDHK